MLKNLLHQVMHLLHQVMRRRSPAQDTAPGLSSDRLEAARSLLDAHDLTGAERALASVNACASAEAIWLRAEIARRRGDAPAAEQGFRAALLLDPRHSESWMGLGVLFRRDRKLDLAFQYFRAALEIRPDDTEALNELGLVDLELGNRSEARNTFERILDLDPRHAHAWNNLGSTLAAQGDLAEARRAFRRALSLQPHHLTACANLGLACRDLNRSEEACDVFRTALQIAPESAVVRVGYALALQDLGDLEAAHEQLDRALTFAPHDVDALSAMGALLQRLGRLEEARQRIERALELAPENAEANLAMAHLLLATGQFTSGWERYEARLKCRASPRRSYSIPYWDDAEPPRGRRVLVYGEQGLGEQIMFASMLCNLAREAEVTLECAPRLRALFARSFEGVRVLGQSEPVLRGAYDACIAIGSLARYYRREACDFPPHAGYLRADGSQRSAQQAQLRRHGSLPRIGIAWRGGLANTGRALRSLQVNEVAALCAAYPALWVCLQHDAEREEIAEFRRYAPIQHDGLLLADMDASAALIAALDLVIAPCSTVVHLAGALGRPVWVLTPFAPAWRYGIKGESFPWYPAARLFRQEAHGEWPPVLEAIRRSLVTLPEANAA